MKQAISVIVCTHNPRRDYLDKVLVALKSQTLSLDQWELLLVDNASEQLLSAEIDFTWHKNARHIRENQLGLTPARLRGIRSAQAEVLVFVDDDNVLDSDYLELTLRISKDFPFLGAWGGQIKLDFEVPPPDWTRPYWKYLGIREFDRDIWSNLLSHQYDMTPCGAGICVRKVVAEEYVSLVSNDSKRLSLDRKGKSLMSCGDTDLALTACDIGLGIGQFKSLNLTHLIPPTRVEEKYLVRLVEGIEYSHQILESFRGKKPDPLRISWQRRLIEYYRLLRMSPKHRRIYKASKRGKALAIQQICYHEK